MLELILIFADGFLKRFRELHAGSVSTAAVQQRESLASAGEEHPNCLARAALNIRADLRDGFSYGIIPDQNHRRSEPFHKSDDEIVYEARDQDDANRVALD